MKKKITLKRFLHHNVWRYGIYFDYDPGIISVIKKMPGVSYSGTNKCWHVPCEEEVLKSILVSLRGKVDVDISAISSPSDSKRILNMQGRFPEVKDETKYQDEVFEHPRTVRRIIGQPGRYEEHCIVSFSVNETNGKLVIKFRGRYDPGWIKEMRTFGKLYYDKVRKEWVLPWSQMTVDSLADYFMEKGIKIKIEKSTVSQLVKARREEAGADIRDRTLNKRVSEGINRVRYFLNENRYSKSTIESYIASLELFFKFYDSRNPEVITDNDISGFFNEYILKNKYSTSYQNQIVSAIKLYYSINRGNDINILKLVRPRRGRSLPKVFSKEEVKRIINSTPNQKHRLILLIIYSCGLRRSEVTNIRLRDLDRDRCILNIMQAKGMVDRIVPVPAIVWKKIDEYLEGYHPVIYLFEGQSGGRYSSESVYRVFKQSLGRAGIDKEVGVHSLRHSYATHLHESGLDIRYIQELLGHKSTRTTEIYTHISRRNIMEIRSPIEDMDLK